MFDEYEASLLDFLSDLSTHNPDEFTKEDWKLVRHYTRSDGCTKVIDIFTRACWEHDFYNRTHHDFEGKVITFAEANCRFRRRIQRLSRLGVFSLVSWWRWAGVSILGRKYWDQRKGYHP